MSPARHIASSFLLLTTALVAQSEDAKPVSTVFPVDGITLHGEERWVTTRVVDGITGAPLPNAEMLLIAESPHPLRGKFWFERRIAADADGFLRVRVDAKAPDAVTWHWLVIRTPDHGPFSAMGRPPGPITRLAPALDARVRVLDPLGKPVANAGLGLAGGCGHSPDLVHGISDADGLVVLHGVDVFMDFNDLYVEHPALALAYTGLQWLPGQGPMELRVERGIAAHGIVVDTDGKPMAGVFVGTKHVHRGPWTQTDAHGAFRLCGGGEEDDLFVHLGEREILFARAPTMPLRLQVPPPDGNKVQVVNLPKNEAVAACSVLARVTGGHGEPLPGSRVRWIGPAPDRAERASTYHEPLHEIELAPGRYDVITSADDHAATSTTVIVPDAPTHEVQLQPRALPTVLVRALDLPAEADVRLFTASSMRDIGDAVRLGIPIGVPEEPFWVELGWQHGVHRTFAFEPQEALARGTLRLPWWRPTRVEGRLVDREGNPARATLALVPCGNVLRGLPDVDELQCHEKHGAIALTTEHTGLAYVVVQPDQGPGRWQMLPLMLPPRSDDAFVDLGTIDIDAKCAVRILGADGEPLDDARVSLLRTGWVDVRDDTPPTFPLDAAGDWHGPAPKAGDALLVLPPAAEEAEERDAKQPATKPKVVALPVRFPVQGAGPWTFTLPGGALDVDVRGDDGAAIPCTVVLGAEAVELTGPTHITRVPAGPLRLYVASQGRQSAIVDVMVPTSGAVAVRCTLPKR